MPLAIPAIIGGVGAAVGGIAQGIGASRAADAQAAAARDANARLEQQYQRNSANLAPWMTGGQNAFGVLQHLTGTDAGGDPMTAALTSRFAPTMAQLEQTPGYQFTLGQGLKATQSSYASKGLGSSGAAMKGATDYATGLAGNTYQQQFQNYWGENKSIYDMLTGQSNVGANAAAALTSGGNTLAQGVSANTIGAGNAQAAGYNAIGSAVGNATQGIAGYGILGNYLSNGTQPAAAPWGTQTGSPFYGPLGMNA